MKTCKRILAVLLLLSCVFVLASCGTFGGIKKNFIDAGWIYVEVAEDSNDAKAANTIVAELEDGDLSCTLHIFKKDFIDLGIATTYKFAFVLEFKSDAEMQKAFEENGSATLKGLITDAQNSKYVNGNCILLPSVGDVIGDLLDMENEKVEIFTKNKA